MEINRSASDTEEENGTYYGKRRVSEGDVVLRASPNTHNPPLSSYSHSSSSSALARKRVIQIKSDLRENVEGSSGSRRGPSVSHV